MTEYDDELRGVLFPEHNKKHDKSPDFTGKVQVEGVEYRLAAWKRTSGSGRGFLSLSLNVNEPREVDPDDAAALEI